jgi:hypothetical protein
VVNCTRTTDGLNPRSYGLVLSMQSGGATIVTAITPQLSFTVRSRAPGAVVVVTLTLTRHQQLVSENSILVGDLRNPYTLQLRYVISNHAHARTCMW